LCVARSITSTTADGTPLSCNWLDGSRASWCASRSSWKPPLKGRAPVSSWNAVTPRAYTSLRAETRPSNISGAM
jgi:hypothetical protein